MTFEALTEQSRANERHQLLMTVRPREARVVVTRILRQAEWDWGHEPAVGSLILAAHIAGLEGLRLLDEEWERIRTSRLERITVRQESPAAWHMDCAGGHAFVIAPFVLDHLLLGSRQAASAMVDVVNCSSPQLLAALDFFAAGYGMSFSLQAGSTRGSWLASAAARRSGRSGEISFSPLVRSNFLVEPSLWTRLNSRAADYLVPESEISRRHAGDGTREAPYSGTVLGGIDLNSGPSPAPKGRHPKRKSEC